jgi:hypothetical protein
METWEWILFIIVALAGMAILILVATTYFKTEYSPKEITGDKQLAIGSILDLAYRCYERNEGRRDSVVCYKFNIDLNEEISASDILGQIDSKKIDKELVESDDLGSSGEIVIIYENQFIYIEKVEYERVSS